MLKYASKLLGIFLLLLLSFIYTEKVINEARDNDPIMKSVIKYKKENDIKPEEPIINGDELFLGVSGLLVNKKKSYKNMKKDNMFNDEKISYYKINPKTSITNNYNYFITKGNNKKKYIAIIFKINSNRNIDSLLSLAKKNNVILNYFIDGAWLENNVDFAFKINSIGSEIYNLGYNNVYSKNMIKVTNNLIESITLKKSNLCLNEEKNNDYKEICEKNKMISITPLINDFSITEVKKNLENGQMILYDLTTYDLTKFNLLISIIESRGYEITGLSKLINESN
ncbi:MAG: hypothetical protein IJ094_12220 [Bacilli bacterium]|nr:hypothetical protein [Bacilli bacterium]